MSSSLDIFQHNPSKFPTAKLEKQQNFNFLNYQMPKNLLQNSELREKLQKFTLAICWRSIKIDDLTGLISYWHSTVYIKFCVYGYSG